MAEEPLKFVEQVVSLEYKVRASPLALEYAENLRKGQITGHKCPQCGLVQTPPAGFCSICVIPTNSDEHGVEIADRGTLTSFTIVDPIQYRGQQERDVYALASVLLDGADGATGQQRIKDVPLDEIRMGMRVEAVWLREEERKSADGGRGRAGMASAISHWRPSGEPDTPLEEFAEHII